MDRSLNLNASDLTTEAGWIAKMKTAPGSYADAVEVTTLLGALQLRRADAGQFRESLVVAQGAGQETISVDAAKFATLLKETYQARKGSGEYAELGVADERLAMERAGRTVLLRASATDPTPWPNFTPTADPAILGVGQVTAALVAVGSDPTLPMLTAVAFDDGSMVATDRFRMTRIRYDDSGFTTLVPGEALRAIVTPGVEIIRVQPGTSRDDKGRDTDMVRLTSASRSIIAPVPDVTFPNWRQLIPDTAAVSVMLRRDDLLAAIGGENVTLTVAVTEAGGALRLCSSDDDVEIEQSIRVDMLAGGGELPFTVKLRTKYLLEYLRSSASGVVRLDATTPLKPVVFMDPTENYVHLIMPIRTPAATPSG